MINKEKVVEVLKEIYDPEIPINIYDLGLIYNLEIKDEEVYILMTLTFPGCPMGNYLVETVKERLKSIEGVKKVEVELTFDPPWSPEKIKSKFIRESR